MKTGSDNSPSFNAKAASSNGFCIAPFPKGPKSPPRLADEQSEYLDASSAKDDLPQTICSRYAGIKINRYVIQILFTKWR